MFWNLKGNGRQTDPRQILSRCYLVAVHLHYRCPSSISTSKISQIEMTKNRNWFGVKDKSNQVSPVQPTNKIQAGLLIISHAFIFILNCQRKLCVNTVYEKFKQQKSKQNKAQLLDRAFMQYEKKQFLNTKTSRILRYSSWLQRGERIKSHFAIAVYYIDENLNAIKGQHMSCTPIIFPLFRVLEVTMRNFVLYQG